MNEIDGLVIDIFRFCSRSYLDSITASSIPIDTFVRFPRLPPELRLLVWEQALSARAVVAVSRPPVTATEADPAPCRPLTTRFIGPAPYLAGLSCGEARTVMKKSYVQLTGQQDDRAKAPWVDMDKTVFCLGDCVKAVDILDGFNAGELSQFKHIAIEWYRFQILMIVPFCRYLSRACPALETLIVERIGSDPSNNSLADDYEPGLDVVSYYRTLIAYTGPELGRRPRVDPGAPPDSWSFLRSCLPQSSSLRLHIVTHPDFARFRSRGASLLKIKISNNSVRVQAADSTRTRTNP